MILSCEQINSILEIISRNKNIFKTSYVLKLNKPSSFLIFILKEIYEYVTKITEDGIVINELRLERLKIIKRKEFLAKIDKILKAN